MHGRLTYVLVAWAAAIAVACGAKGKETDADVGDTVDAWDLVEADVPVDTGPEVEPDTGPDVEPDAEPDTEPDVTDIIDDDAPDCIPSGVGSPPSADLDVCLRAANCVALPFPGGGGFMEYCTSRSIYEGSPRYGEARVVMGMQMLEYFFEEVDANSSCIGAAGDCDAVLACLNGGSSSSTCTTPAPGRPVNGAGCTGDVLDVCIVVDAGTTNGRIFQHDCSSDGLSCVSFGVMGSACMQTDCTTSGDPACAGDDVDWCITAGAHVVIDCDEMSHGAGGTCGDVDPLTSVVEAGCVPSGGACDPTSDAAYCTGDVLNVCNTVYAGWTTRDCTLIGTGWYCNDTVDPNECRPDVSAWSCTLTPEPGCDCDDIVLCNPFTGTDLRVHCPDYGYRTCGDTDPSTPEIEVGCID